jgi:hypothetical protein
MPLPALGQGVDDSHMIGATACPACGFQNEGDATFCANCGGRLDAAVPRSRAARSAAVAANQSDAGTGPSSVLAASSAAWSDVGTAVFLELLPVVALIAMVVLFALISIVESYELHSVAWLLGITTLVSGAGWISIGRPGLGCGLMAVRAVAMLGVFILLGRAFFAGWDCSGTECDDSQLMGRFAMAGGIVAVILVPIASAIVLGVSARRRAASVSARSGRRTEPPIMTT